MSQRDDRIAAQLAKPAGKREVGHHRDPLGFLALVSLLPPDHPVLIGCELPKKIDCLTCRFQDREWAGEPCLTCLDDYTEAVPYPKWREMTT